MQHPNARKMKNALLISKKTFPKPRKKNINEDIILIFNKILFLFIRSINVPAYKPQNKPKNVNKPSQKEKVELWFKLSAKCQGTAIMVIPWAIPEGIIDNNSCRIFLEFIFT